jgi:deferrochelatase/peroxidase EfeB
VTFAPVERQRLISRPQLADDKYTRNDDLNREAFGFADGISQPIIRGTRRWIAMRDANHVVEPGEIVLGYPDNRRRLPPSPSVLAADDPDHLLPSFGSDPFRERPDFSRPQPTSERDFGRNGAFLVVRQLAQDKSGFRRFVEAAARRLDGDARAPADPVRRREWIMAKLVGRWPDGTSLVRYPHAPGTADDRLARPDNDFLYGADDRSGLRCPLGAHIRRMNPRDSLAPEQAETIAITNRHRILRVGRNYKQGREAGIFFMCLNADIERQFEFVQQTWARGSAFHGLDNEVDCLAPRGATSCISIPTPEGSIVLERMKNFVAVRGGGYFFMPGRRAIRFLIRAGLDQDRTTMTTSAAADPTSAPLEPVRA